MHQEVSSSLLAAPLCVRVNHAESDGDRPNASLTNTGSLFVPYEVYVPNAISAFADETSDGEMPSASNLKIKLRGGILWYNF